MTFAQVAIYVALFAWMGLLIAQHILVQKDRRQLNQRMSELERVMAERWQRWVDQNKAWQDGAEQRMVEAVGRVEALCVKEVRDWLQRQQEAEAACDCTRCTDVEACADRAAAVEAQEGPQEPAGGPSAAGGPDAPA